MTLGKPDEARWDQRLRKVAGQKPVEDKRVRPWSNGGERPIADVRGCEITLIGLRPNHQLVLALPARRNGIDRWGTRQTGFGTGS